jgi:hypothetical protein
MVTSACDAGKQAEHQFISKDNLINIHIGGGKEKKDENSQERGGKSQRWIHRRIVHMGQCAKAHLGN